MHHLFTWSLLSPLLIYVVLKHLPLVLAFVLLFEYFHNQTGCLKNNTRLKKKE